MDGRSAKHYTPRTAVSGAWLSKNHKTAKDIWLIYYNKASGKPRIPYNDAVEEALCYGWIDSIVKKYDKDRAAQRFSPRNPKRSWSEMNIEPGAATDEARQDDESRSGSL